MSKKCKKKLKKKDEIKELWRYIKELKNHHDLALRDKDQVISYLNDRICILENSEDELKKKIKADEKSQLFEIEKRDKEIAKLNLDISCYIKSNVSMLKEISEKKLEIEQSKLNINPSPPSKCERWQYSKEEVELFTLGYSVCRNNRILGVHVLDTLTGCCKYCHRKNHVVDKE